MVSPSEVPAAKRTKSNEGMRGESSLATSSRPTPSTVSSRGSSVRRGKSKSIERREPSSSSRKALEEVKKLEEQKKEEGKKKEDVAKVSYKFRCEGN